MLQRSWAPVLRSATAVALGLGLSAIYLVPAAVEQRWVQIRQATDDPGLAIENSFLFGRHADPNLELHDVELWRVSAIAVLMIGLTFLMRLHRVASRTAPSTHLVDSARSHPRCCAAAAISHFASALEHPAQAALSPVSMALARRGRSAALGIFFAAAIWHARRWRRVIAIGASSAIFLSITVVTLFIFHQDCDSEDSVKGMLAPIAAARVSKEPMSTHRRARTTA